MTSPLQSIGSFFSHAIQPVTSVLQRAITPPGMGGQQQQPDINIPAPPPTPAPAQLPSSKSARKSSMQDSFLSGATQAFQSGFSIGAGAGGSGSGKTLLGQ